MAFASITYTSASGTTFALTNSDGNAIEYLRQSDISVTVNGTLQTLTTDYTFNAAGTAIVLNTAVSGATVLLKRDTSIVDATVDFTAGSTLTADDLNNSDKQNRFALQEFSDIYDALDTGTGDLGDLGGFIDSGETWTSDDAHAATTGAIDARVDSKIDSALTGDVVAGNAITISDNTPSSGKITIAVTDATIDTAELAGGAVTSAKIADSNVTTAKINNAAVTTAKIADANVTTAKLANDAVTSAKIADGTIVAGDIAGNAVTTAKILDANVTTAKIADANVTTDKIANDAVTQAKMANNSVGTAEILDGNVTSVKLADAELKELATMGTATAQALADLTAAEVQVLDGATVTTAELNKLDGVTATTTELNVVDGITATTSELNQLDGNTLTNSFTASSTTQYPSSNAISNYVVGLMDSLGGFVAIADEVSFPNTNPDPSDDAGTVVSISDAGGVVVDSSGVSTTGRTTGGSTVTINGFPTALRSSTLPAGQGLQVVSTSTLNTYNYHKVLATDADIAQLSDDVNDFFARYRIGDTNPTTDLDAGDLFFNTSTGKMLVYDATTSAWEEVQAVGNYYINTLSSSSGTGGGSATFNGSAFRFTLSNPGTYAQQHIVSINGVIQKPNSGTGQPSEGFAIDGSDIIFGAAPATGADFFIVTVGTSVNIGTPSNNTVDTVHLVDGAVTNAKVSSSAAIAGTKISPNFGSQNVVTTGSAGFGTASPSAALHAKSGTTDVVADFESTDANAWIQIRDNSTTDTAVMVGAVGNDMRLRAGSNERVRIDSDGKVQIGRTSPLLSTELTVGGDNGLTVGKTNGSRIGMFGSFNQDLLIIGTYDNYPVVFRQNNTEQMRIDSSGRVLLGLTSGSGGKLQVNGGIRVAGSGSPSDTNSPYIYRTSGTDNLCISTSSTERLRIDSSGLITQGGKTASNHGSPNLLLWGADSTLHITSTGSVNNSSYAGIKFAIAGGSTGDYSKAGIFVQRQDSYNDLDMLFAFRASNDATGVSPSDEKMRIDSSGNLLVGTTTASGKMTVKMATNKNISFSGAQGEVGSVPAFVAHQDGGSLESIGMRGVDIRFATGSAERMRVDSSGKVGIGTSSPTQKLSLQNGTFVISGSSSFSSNVEIGRVGGDNNLAFATGGTERARILSNGTMLVAQTADSFGVAGHILAEDGRAFHISSNTNPMNLNRQSSDGTLVLFAQDGTTEGNISVSGSTVSYNGGHLSRWSQLAGGAARTEILRGSVLSNLDEMCEWGEENNEQLNRMKVSDVEGDVNVAGVFQGWDDDDDTYTNDFYCAMTGDFVIRLAQGNTSLF